jgi:hypothetical protein
LEECAVRATGKGISDFLAQVPNAEPPEWDRLLKIISASCDQRPFAVVFILPGSDFLVCFLGFPPVIFFDFKRAFGFQGGFVLQ